MPPAMVTRLNHDLNKALADPGVLKRFTDFGMEPVPTTPEQFGAMTRQLSQRWGAIIKASGITLD